MKAAAIIAELENKYPLHLAAPWDNPGLQAGRRDREVNSIYIGLDATEAVIADAVQKEADFLLTHHPLLMSPLKLVNTDDFIGRRIIKLIQADISYYAIHTNHDVVTMAPLAGEMLKLKSSEVLEITYLDEDRKAGFGQIGELPEAMTLQECGEYVKKVFDLENVKIFGDLSQPVNKAAISPGSGKSMIDAALKAGAQVLISGDFGHHDGTDAVMQGLGVIDAGHYGLEHIFIPQMAAYIKDHFPGIRVYCEEIENPFRVI